MTALGMAGERGGLQRASRRSRSGRMVCAVAILFFVASAAATIVWCLSMSDMVVPMPGGWTLSMMWQPMCGRTWARTAASFLGMWVVMMVAMMLPSQMPMLQRYVCAVEETGGTRPARLTAIIGLGYFCIWTAIGIMVFPIGAALATLVIETPALARGVPMMMGVIVLGAGALQFTAWKARRLACCRSVPSHDHVSPDAIAAWRYGLRHGVQCARCCGNLMAILLAFGTMNLTAMVVVTIAITAERIAPAGARVVRGIGMVTIMLGLFLIARAL
jgi:predicted metal-binding membrane protein